MGTEMDPYLMAQSAIANLKSAVRTTLENGPVRGMSNAQIGKSLGIHASHVEHAGHISQTILALLESEGVVMQDAGTKLWSLVDHTEGPQDT